MLCTTAGAACFLRMLTIFRVQWLRAGMRMRLCLSWAMFTHSTVKRKTAPTSPYPGGSWSSTASCVRWGFPLVTVLLSSKPLAIPEIAHSTDALVCAFNGGMFGGQAVAEAIFGRLNPSGRLPISFPHHSGQVPVYYNHLPGWHWGHYSDLPAEPLFTFGEGIGYAPFVYRDLAVDADALTLSVKVRNAGDIAGEETVQVYLRDCVCEVMQPVKQLIAFRKVLLQPGEEQEVVFHLDRTAFTYINRAEERVFAPGDFMLMAGHSAKDEDLLKETVWVG